MDVTTAEAWRDYMRANRRANAAYRSEQAGVDPDTERRVRRARDQQRYRDRKKS